MDGCNYTESLKPASTLGEHFRFLGHGLVNKWCYFNAFKNLSQILHLQKCTRTNNLDSAAKTPDWNTKAAFMNKLQSKVKIYTDLI